VAAERRSIMRSPSSSTAWSGSPIISTAISPARRGTISRLGQFLDPIADKIMVAAVIVMLMASRKAGRRPIIEDWHIIPALVILLREIIVSGLREFLARCNVSMPVSALAKWKTTFQLVALGALILGGAVPGSRGCTWSGSPACGPPRR
jgi:phosphatidylglycerophosphate synthase